MENNNNFSTVGVLMMIKNEENSIEISLNSIKDYFQHIIIFDTGSTDNTIDTLKNICKKNNLTLHFKIGEFKTFPESRNEAIEFAETTVDVNFLLLMDAGDEFKCDLSKNNFYEIINSIPLDINFGLVKKRWLETNKKTLEIETNDHNDLRFIRNKKKCRYDLSYPVHETFLNVEKHSNLTDIFLLFQDRVKFGKTTEKRYLKDIEQLLKAPKTKRNFFFLAQTYMCINDFVNGFKYNVLSLETSDNISSTTSKQITLLRSAYCAIMAKMSLDIIFNYLEQSIENYIENPIIEPFIFLMKVSIDNNCTERVMPYIDIIYNLKKPTTNYACINHNFYDYLRWNLLSTITLLSGEKLDLGEEACKKAIYVKNLSEDLNNLKLFKQLK